MPKRTPSPQSDLLDRLTRQNTCLHKEEAPCGAIPDNHHVPVLEESLHLLSVPRVCLPASSQALQLPILPDDDRCIRDDDYMKLDSGMRDLLTDAKFVTIPGTANEIILPGEELGPGGRVSSLVPVQPRISR